MRLQHPVLDRKAYIHSEESQNFPSMVIEPENEYESSEELSDWHVIFQEECFHIRLHTE